MSLEARHEQQHHDAERREHRGGLAHFDPVQDVGPEGHTDQDPIKKSHWKDNQELSEKRADAVRDYLVAKGIDTGLINTQGLGDTRLLTTDLAKKAQNRRVEIVVVTR